MARRLALVSLVAAVGVVALAGSPGAVAGGGCHASDTLRLTDERTDRVLASDCAFMPAVVRADAGEPVTWMNSDRVPHTFTGVAGTFGDHREYTLGESVTYMFEKPGVYPYFCALHPSMAGVVVVGDGAPSEVRAGAAVRQVASAAAGVKDAGAPNAAGPEDGNEVSATVAAVVAGLAGLLAGGVVGAAVTRWLLPR